MKLRIQTGLLVIFAFLILFILSCDDQKTDKSDLITKADFFIENVNIIDAENGLQQGMTVVIKDNKIVNVAKSNMLNVNSDVLKIDGTAKYLIPGLWDAHVHLSFEEKLTPTMLKLFLAYGITSIRDTGGQLELVLPEREKARKNPKNNPRVMIAGPLLDGVPTVYTGHSPSNPHLAVGINTVEDALSITEEMLAANVDFLKVYEMLSPEAFKTILSTAQSKGIPVTGHVPLSMDVVEASDAGLNSMEHLRNLEFACSSDWEQLLQTRQKLLFEGKEELGSTLRRNIHKAQRIHAIANQDSVRRAEVLHHLAVNNTWQIPTLSIMTAAAERFIVRPDWHESFKYLPDTIQKTWTENSLAFAKSPMDLNRRAYADWLFEMIAHLKKAQVGIMAGTDCPIFHLTPGYSLHEELALLVKGGLTPMEAIEAATLKPAEYFGIEKELGLVQEGMYADLLLLDANPLEDIRNSKKINAVIRDGKLHDRKALDILFSELENESF